MRRVLALARKELWQHGLVVLALYLLLAGVAALLLFGVAVAQRTISVLESHATFVRFFVPLAALALSQRLVVDEYSQGTQRLLEALPIRRWEVVVTKLALGVIVISMAAMASLALSSAVAAIREPLTLRWLALVAFKTELFTVATFAVVFAIAMTGRLPMPIYLALLFVMLFVGQATDAELSRFGPIALVGDRLVLERHALPLGDVAVTTAIAFLGLAIALGLALAREGQVAAALARRMTAREKSAVGLVLVLAMVGSEFADARKPKEPFTFTEDEVLRRDDPRVEILYLEERHRQAAEALADVVARDLLTVKRTLGIASLPAVHVALQETLDPRVPEPVEREDREGILVHSSFDAPGFDREALRAAVLAEVFEEVTDGRAAFEPMAWVRTGFARAFVERDGARSRAVSARAAWVSTRRRPSFAMLARWQRTEERFGPAAAEALACTAGRAVESRAGRPRTERFARSLLAREPPWGMAAVIEARRDPIEARLARETRLTTDALVEAWRAEIARSREGARLPRARGSIAIERAEGDLRSIRWRVEDPPVNGTCALVHASLGPFDRPLAPADLFREERACAELDREGERLVGRYGIGERVFAAIEIDGDALDAPVRIATARMEVR